MKKTFKLNNLDCANCAAKMERGILKLEGIKSASVNFIMQKMTLEIDDAANLPAVLSAVKETCRKVEPDCEIIGIL